MMKPCQLGLGESLSFKYLIVFCYIAILEMLKMCNIVVFGHVMQLLLVSVLPEKSMIIICRCMIIYLPAP